MTYGKTDALMAAILASVDYAVNRAAARVLWPVNQFSLAQTNQPDLEAFLNILPQAKVLGVNENFALFSGDQPAIAYWWLLYDREKLTDYGWLKMATRNSLFSERTFFD